MAHHNACLKHIRQTDNRRTENRYKAVSMRNAVRKLRTTTDKTEAAKMLPEVNSMLDKLVQDNLIHKNKASNLKSKLTRFVNKLQK